MRSDDMINSKISFFLYTINSAETEGSGGLTIFRSSACEKQLPVPQVDKFVCEEIL